MSTRLELMQEELEATGARAIEFSWYGVTGALLFSLATFRYGRAPQFAILGTGIGCGAAFVEGNKALQKTLTGSKEAEGSNDVIP